MHLLALSGSLRAASFNTALLRAAAEGAPDGVIVTLHDYRDVPLYDPDLGLPPGVERLRAAISAADGLLIATPEFNYGIPGPLKNAIDWASRPAYRSPFAGKPVAVMSASPGPIGGARGLQQLKTVLLGMSAVVYPAPELAVGGVGEKIVEGRLVDAVTAERLARLVAGFAAWAPGARFDVA
ncbi:MAG: NAD(P)H-dependent oxidoreductase [Myxococcales bacterium]|nr:NAD(P)H-dependent oxidoreductase [Myxococcales bacterium]